jgi:nucleoside-diphosphate-sugar epimerase
LKIFVSGAAGYIGGAIARHAAATHSVYGGVRRKQELGPGVKPVITGDLAETRFGLPEVDVVVHAAGLGHKRGVNRATWQRQNVDAALNLARAAKLVEAKQSKLDAERAVVAVFGPNASIIRPTAVIGPGCPGNVQLLIKLLRRGIPLPFASLQNRRGFIPVADLAALALAVAQAETPPPVVLAAHPETISTPALIRALADGLGVPARLVPCPAAPLGLGATLLGRGAMWQSLSGNFETAPRAALALGWKPAESLAESLAATARYHNTTHKTP